MDLQYLATVVLGYTAHMHSCRGLCLGHRHAGKRQIEGVNMERNLFTSYILEAAGTSRYMLNACICDPCVLPAAFLALGDHW